MQRYKFLRLSGGETIQSEFGVCFWEVGKWKRRTGKISLCQRGFHCATSPWLAFSHVQGEILAEVEVDGRSVSSSDGKEAWERMRLIQVWRWRAEDSLALAVFAVEKVIGNWERLYPSDIRPLAALDAAKQVLNFLEEEAPEASAEVRAASREVAARTAKASMSAARAATANAIEAVWTTSPETVDEVMAEAARSAAAAAWSAAAAAWSAARSAALEVGAKVQAAAANDAYSAALSAASAAEAAAWVRSMSVAPQAPVASWAEAGASAREAFLEDVSLWMRERVRALPVLSADG
jgi:PIN domain nuclease of toxin-antitoxin system